MTSTRLKVNIEYGDLRAEFEGDPSEVYASVIRFLEKAIPTYSLASRIAYSTDLQTLLEQLSDIIAYNQREGVLFLKPINALPAADAILLFLAKRYIEHALGLRDSPTASFSEIQSAIGKPDKTVSGRLSELLQKGYVRRLDRGDYTITTLALKMLTEAQPKPHP
ncbi:MAG TPA: hypothetical protein EYH45_04905 [Candidatus Caldiarchaeum subterraneum]|uniref:Uncharacterized protein n=1 Tax=Caldiarchaeum subterraneum TaxID=311458 RepID=A0A833ECK1_CALS0|nr:hypothetical protein [Candidatus Caldarchaeum subterraneum]